MTDYKYRVYDEATGSEFADVANLSLALLVFADLKEKYPQTTIDEIFLKPTNRKDKLLAPGDQVAYVGPLVSWRGHLGVVDNRSLPNYGGDRVGVTWDDGDKSGEAVTDLIRI